MIRDDWRDFKASRYWKIFLDDVCSRVAPQQQTMIEEDERETSLVLVNEDGYEQKKKD